MEWFPEGWIPKAIAVDIDGTITDSNKKIHLEAIEWLRKLESVGIPILLSTGNVRSITYGLWRFIGATGPMVCENGGVVWHPGWGEVILRADGKRAYEAAKFVGEKLGLDHQGITTNSWRESEWCLFPNEDLEAITNLIENSEYSDLAVLRTGFAIHLMEPHLSKGSGLEIALERIGIAPEDVLAVGDAPNDISMFELVGHSIAVGGSFKELEECASVISPYPHGDTFKPMITSLLDRL